VKVNIDDVLRETIITAIIAKRTLDSYRARQPLPYFQCTECGEHVDIDFLIDYQPLRDVVSAHLASCVKA
jgi:hypothetical protein